MSDISEGYHDYADELKEEERKYRKKIQNELSPSEIQELEETDYSYTPEEIEQSEKEAIINNLSYQDSVYGSCIAQTEYDKILLSDYITPIFIQSNLDDNNDEKIKKIYSKHAYPYDALVVVEHKLNHKFVYHGTSTIENDNGFMYKTLFAIPVMNVWIKIMGNYLERYELTEELAKNKDIYKKWLRFINPEYCKKWDTSSIKPKILTNINDFPKRDILDILSRKKKEELVIDFSSKNSEIVNLKDIYDTAIMRTVQFNHDSSDISPIEFPTKICKSYKKENKKEEIPF